MKTIVSLAISLSILVHTTASAQYVHDSTISKNRRNVVRVNPTPSLIVGAESFVMGYERVLPNFQSLSVNIGSLKFRRFLDLGLEEYDVNTTRKSGGLSIAVDYRRYFKGRNRGYPPDGLYWAPFFTYYGYKHEMGLTYSDPISLTKTEASLTADLDVIHVGVELGYQLVLAKRVCIDFILLGPSFGNYRADFNMEGNLGIDQESDLYEAISEVLANRVPGLGNLIDERSARKTGGFNTNTIGMRYAIQIGILF